MNDTAEFWSSTGTAQTPPYAGVIDVHPGSFILSLLLICALLLALAWGWRRLRGAAAPAAPAAEDRVVFYSRFNAHQSLAIVARGRRVQCLVFRGRQVELAAEVPGLSAGGGESQPARPGTAGVPASFHDIWRAVRGRGKPGPV